MTLQQQPFELAVENAEAQLAQAQAQLALLATELEEAKADIEIAKAQNAYAVLEFQRFQKLVKERSASVDQLDEKREQSNIAKSTLLKSTKSLQNLQQQRPLQQALVAQRKSVLGRAKYDLSLSKLRAPRAGFVNNLKVYAGDYAREGDVLFGLVAINSEVVIANVKESNLVDLSPGDSAWVYLSNRSWHLYRAEVHSIGRGVARNNNSDDASLPYVEPITNWIRYDYRIPVRFKLLNFPGDKSLPVGIDARVIVL